MTPIKVRSTDEEDALLGRCGCGGEWKLLSEDVIPLHEQWYDALILRCASCSALRRAIFDISAFFRPTSKAWA
jgi:hypothetical protein